MNANNRLDEYFRKLDADEPAPQAQVEAGWRYEDDPLSDQWTAFNWGLAIGIVVGVLGVKWLGF